MLCGVMAIAVADGLQLALARGSQTKRRKDDRCYDRFGAAAWAFTRTALWAASRSALALRMPCPVRLFQTLFCPRAEVLIASLSSPGDSFSGPQLLRMAAMTPAASPVEADVPE